jgi:hypothetical protein
VQSWDFATQKRDKKGQPANFLTTWRRRNKGIFGGSDSWQGLHRPNNGLATVLYGSEMWLWFNTTSPPRGLNAVMVTRGRQKIVLAALRLQRTVMHP